MAHLLMISDDLPFKNGDFPVRYVKKPEDNNKNLGFNHNKLCLNQQNRGLSEKRKIQRT
jgi:hypothetical protein